MPANREHRRYRDHRAEYRDANQVRLQDRQVRTTPEPEIDSRDEQPDADALAATDHALGQQPAVDVLGSQPIHCEDDRDSEEEHEAVTPYGRDQAEQESRTEAGTRGRSVRRSNSSQIAANSSSWTGISDVLSRENATCGSVNA